VFSTFTIQTESTKKRQKLQTTKSRVFSVQLLGFLTADALWEPWNGGAQGSTQRPVWIAYIGTESESQPFTANLRGGRKAAAGSDVVETPRRAGYRWTYQKVPGGLVTVAYLPELFHLEPVKASGESIRFIVAPPLWWIAEQAAVLAPDFGAEAEEAARAALFCAYLDRRTALPLVHDLRFHLQVYRAALKAGWTHQLASSSQRGEEVLVGRGAEAAGLDAPVACSVGEAALTDFLIQQTSLYHREEIRRGKTRIEASRRLLPYPGEAAPQLCLDFAVA
jgi:hypothetical protein